MSLCKDIKWRSRIIQTKVF